MILLLVNILALLILTKISHELPRFPINEKYGDLERFKFLIKLNPLQYKSLKPEDKYITDNNPPKLSVEFFENQKNIENINCFSDEGRWSGISQILLLTKIY